MFLGSWLLLMVDGWGDSLQKQKFTIYSMPIKELVNHYISTDMFIQVSVPFIFA